MKGEFMQHKAIAQQLGFTPKENTSGVFSKVYAGGYSIELDFKNEAILYGEKITSESKTTQNFSQAENWVVLECVNRLLEKGYPPQNIVLEKTWKTGHGTSGRLDILVTRDDGSAYLMIECKTWGEEFDKEFKNLEKNGGQLFTYFQQDRNAEIIMLYASVLDGKAMKFRNEIIKIEEGYRQTANVKDFFERWNKLPKSNGVLDAWVTAYEFQSKALTKKDLKVLKQEDSSFIFNRFLEILRHNVVSDKPNAFNKIFTLFLCKIVDEDRNDDEQLHFQWLEGEDDHISFQKRLTDLYNRGMLELLEKKVTDVSDKEFDKRFQQVDDKYKEQFKEILTEIRLKKNNEFAIKEVFDDASFQENAKVVKEVVELLQYYKIRYNYRQQFLSDFFELLLTTGLKQESGQFFTPVPIARFIIKSLPLHEITEQKISEGNKKDLLPTLIDYAAGSGHFITESMEAIQQHIDGLNPKDYSPSTKRALDSWQKDQFDWAEDYVYGIEKDYRLVKTAKVSCYLHGDGLAKVIHGDGLGDFSTSTEFKDRLTETDKTYPQDNKQFDIIVSNPPYSVSAFKGLMDSEKSRKAFDLYDRLTDQSSEIECLFIERTKQLLKDGGVAGIILPSSILSNTGIYTQTREILLKHFDIIAIAEMGSNTFMATGTNTVTLFLRRRNNADAINIEAAIKKAFVNLQDVTINGIETPVAKYVTHVWESISFEDYKTLLQKTPNKKVEEHEIYQEYKKKLKAKNDKDLWDLILDLEQDKLLYFIIAHPQKLVLIKTGSKNEEKRFLGYEFSNRRGSEGIHPMQRSKSIDECTQLYDANAFDNHERASTYIYKAFNGEFDLNIPESLKQNISYQNLVDMFTFDRVDFEKNISLAAKKKVKIESKWEVFKLNKLVSIVRGASPRPIKEYTTNEIHGINWIKIGDVNPDSKYISSTKEKITKIGANKSRQVKKGDFILSNSMSFGRPYIMNIDGCIHDGWLLISDFPNSLNKDYLYNILSSEIIQEQFISAASGGTSVDNLNIGKVEQTQIPLPPKDIQQKIVAEIEKLEKQEQKAIEGISNLQKSIYKILDSFPKNLVSTYCKVSSDKENPQNNLDKKYNYLGLEHIESNSGRISMNTEMGENILSAKNKFKKGDVLYGKLRPYLNKVAEPNFEGICSTDILVLNTVVPKLLKYALRSDDFVKQISDLMSGVSLPRIKTKEFLKQKISLPPSAEQEKIVSEIEKIEKKMNILEKQIDLIPQQKEDILNKYLK